MNLTIEEQEMLDGKHGKGIQLATEIVVKMGDLYGAHRLIKVKRAHIDAAAYATIWDAGTDFVEFLVNHGARVAVPTTINPTSRDIKDWEKMGLSKEFSDKCERLETAYINLGVTPTWTCAPYQCTNAPVFGEVVSWSESNAVSFVNSVLGARANRLPDLIDVCCAVIGRVPEYGLFLEETGQGRCSLNWRISTTPGSKTLQIMQFSAIILEKSQGVVFLSSTDFPNPQLWTS